MNGAQELLRLLTPVLERAGSRKYSVYDDQGNELGETPSTCSYCYQDLDGPEPEGHASWCAIERLQGLSKKLDLQDDKVRAGENSWVEAVARLLEVEP
jgi:hypothetical protein